MTRREPWRMLPEKVVLFQTPSGWRFALHSARGILDGRVKVPVGAPSDRAKLALETRIAELTNASFVLTWVEGPGGSWLGQVAPA